MAKIGGKKPIPISNSQLKKEIIKRNNSLKRQNDSLSISIKAVCQPIPSLPLAIIYHSSLMSLPSPRISIPVRIFFSLPS